MDEDIIDHYPEDIAYQGELSEQDGILLEEAIASRVSLLERYCSPVQEHEFFPEIQQLVLAQRQWIKENLRLSVDHTDDLNSILIIDRQDFQQLAKQHNLAPVPDQAVAFFDSYTQSLYCFSTPDKKEALHKLSHELFHFYTQKIYLARDAKLKLPNAPRLHTDGWSNTRNRAFDSFSEGLTEYMTMAFIDSLPDNLQTPNVNVGYYSMVIFLDLLMIDLQQRFPEPTDLIDLRNLFFQKLISGDFRFLKQLSQIYGTQAISDLAQVDHHDAKQMKKLVSAFRLSTKEFTRKLRDYEKGKVVITGDGLLLPRKTNRKQK
jgi:hypothetical protein